MTNKTNNVNSGEEFDWFLGIDWGTAHHAIHLTDATGAPLLEQQIEHTSTGLERFVTKLAELTGGHLERVAVGIEAPRGALIELLLERGAVVFAVNPKQLDRFRDRFSVAGAKDDRLDALVLASAVRTDRPRFRQVAVDDPLVIQVRELTRADEVLLADFTAGTNRLRELVHRIAPEWLPLSSNADEAWFWRFLELAATPRRGRDLRRNKIQQLLKSHRIRRLTAEDVLRVLETPPLHVAPGTVEAVTTHIRLLLPRVRLVHAQRQACARDLEAALDMLEQTPVAVPTPTPPTAPGAPTGQGEDQGPPGAPNDVAILRSVPGAGVVVVSTFIAEAAALLAARDIDGLRAVMGVAPVRQRTGKQKHGTVSMRHACNMRLRNACYFLAFASTRFDETARRYYAQLRQRGHSHGRALRSVADRWLRIIIAMLKSRSFYDPTRFARAPLHDEAMLATA